MYERALSKSPSNKTGSRTGFAGKESVLPITDVIEYSLWVKNFSICENSVRLAGASRHGEVINKFRRRIVVFKTILLEHIFIITIITLGKISQCRNLKIIMTIYLVVTFTIESEKSANRQMTTSSSRESDGKMVFSCNV
jgi:hypothetical protein